ncbi:hypothetical protein [Parvularcula sp. LCG005]|uniref:hypothetical protein n=1 Tax=Parvularcula sp. LCG005 TaxID=3078805 RepID=UPI0029432F09|nr:hypothetical protein [Parvularcula sp. LCG005]WOI51964.1 hypothetical protein RUI03_07320 [Parvularcula sp. LCG005]
MPQGHRLLSVGWDTIQESWDIQPGGPWYAVLEVAKKRAQENREGGEGVAVLEIDGEPWRVSSAGAMGGIRYVIDNGKIMLLIRGQGQAFGVLVRYLSAGLWLDGWEALQVEAEAIVRRLFSCPPVIPVRVSRADWCFDFYAPGYKFDAFQMRKNLVAHSSVKFHIHGTSVHDETFLVGALGNRQLTLYNKTKELKDKPGKEWFYDVWAVANDGEIVFPDEPKDVYRLEVRLGKEAFKNRNIRTRAEVIDHRAETVAGALANIRVVEPGEDSNKDRRPVNPFWSEAIRNCDVSEQIKVGRYVTGKRACLLDQMAAQMAGTIRSYSILQANEVSDGGVEAVVKRVVEIMKNDPEAKKKEKAASERYKFVNGAGDDATQTD